MCAYVGNSLFSISGISPVIHILWVNSTKKRSVDARDGDVVLTRLLLMSHKKNLGRKCGGCDSRSILCIEKQSVLLF